MGDAADYYAERDEELMAEDPEFVIAESKRLLDIEDYDIDEDGSIQPTSKQRKDG